ncbi:hypothetical protein [Staphylococcus aureus]
MPTTFGGEPSQINFLTLLYLKQKSRSICYSF